MTGRISNCFKKLKEQNKKALITFITAGDPDLATTARLLPLLTEAGADIIELGMPFSDPMADGPTIQRSSERALANQMSLGAILDTVAEARKKTEVPVILMGYSNPIYAYGWERFAEDAVKAGVDGLLLVDLPPEESDELLPAARLAGLDLIFLLTPTSDRDRMITVSKNGSGFIYYVTVTGVTGARQSVSSSLAEDLQKIQSLVKLPVVAGFGISTPAQAAQVAAVADGVVVGSAIVRLFEQYKDLELEQQVAGLIRSLKQAVISFDLT